MTVRLKHTCERDSTSLKLNLAGYLLAFRKLTKRIEKRRAISELGAGRAAGIHSWGFQGMLINTA
jgi:hypothetical protein